ELLVLLARLLGVLGPPEDLEAELLAERGIELVLLDVIDADFAFGLDHVLDDGHVLKEVDLARVLVESSFELARRPEDALSGLQDRRFDRLDEDLLLDPLLLRDLLEDAAEARLRTRHRCHRCHDSVFSCFVSKMKPIYLWALLEERFACAPGLDAAFP